MNDYVHIEAADLRRPNARFTTERQGYQVLTPFGKLGYSLITPPAPDSRLGRRPKVAHVVNPVTVGPESDLFVAQPVTFRSMVEARERAKTDLAVELYTVSFPEDNIPSPPAFSTLPPLKRSVLDVGRFERERKLPLIRDVLDAVIHATDADNIIYSNVDISLMPGFYRYVSAKLSDYDALVINRRTIEKAETADFPLEHFYAQPGSLHPGFDCFAFKRALYSRFSLGQACIGANWIGRIVLVNMMAYAANIWVEKEDHLTFHLGDDRSWKITANIDFGVYPGFPTLFWGLSVFFVGDLMGKALWKLVENAARFPRRGGRVLCVHGAVSFHRARPCGPRWLPGRGAMRHVELDRRVLGLQSTGE